LMVNNSTNICFIDIDVIVDHHCLSFLLLCWYWCNYWPSLFKLSFVLLILMYNINKTKEIVNSDGQQFHQYQQNKRKIKQCWSTIPPISTK
jgi:MFS superfamily sulfate permease-like transporter